MTLLEKFYEWWDRADFDEIIFLFILITFVATFVAFIAVLLIELITGGIQ